MFGVVAGDQSVPDADDAAGVARDVLFVRDDKNGVALVGEGAEEGHDFLAGFGVEVAGRLVGEDDGGLTDEGAGDGDALALAAGHFVGLVVDAVSEADIGQRFEGGLAAFVGGDAGVNQGQFDIAEGGGAGQEVESLEDEADFAVANFGEFVVIQLADVGAVEVVGAAEQVSRQPSRFIRVDLPEPEGPMMATYSPRSTASEMSRSAWMVSEPI